MSQHPQREIRGQGRILARLVIAAVFTVGVQAASASATPVDGEAMDTLTAISQAQNSPSRSVKGRFAIEVNGSGREGAFVYLNSMSDYRSPDCLTIVVPRGILAQVKARLGADLEDANGKKIVVDGIAKRAKVWLKPEMRDNRVRHYYQTHVRITSADQLALAE